MTPPRNRIKPRKPESQIARKPAWSPGFLQKRLLQTRGCAAVINRFVILHGRLFSVAFCRALAGYPFGRADDTLLTPPSFGPCPKRLCCRPPRHDAAKGNATAGSRRRPRRFPAKCRPLRRRPGHTQVRPVQAASRPRRGRGVEGGRPRPV